MRGCGHFICLCAAVQHAACMMFAPNVPSALSCSLPCRGVPVPQPSVGPPQGADREGEHQGARSSVSLAGAAAAAAAAASAVAAPCHAKYMPNGIIWIARASLLAWLSHNLPACCCLPAAACLLLPACCCLPQGMTQAYRTLIRMLERQYGGVAASADKSSSSSGGAPAAAGKASSSSGGASAPAGKAARRPLSLGADATAAGAAAAAAGLPADEEGLNISALLQNPQANAAAFLAFVVVMVLLWRIAVAQPLAMQAMRAAASAVGR